MKLEIFLLQCLFPLALAKQASRFVGRWNGLRVLFRGSTRLGLSTETSWFALCARTIEKLSWEAKDLLLEWEGLFS